MKGPIYHTQANFLLLKCYIINKAPTFLVFIKIPDLWSSNQAPIDIPWGVKGIEVIEQNHTGKHITGKLFVA